MNRREEYAVQIDAADPSTRESADAIYRGLVRMRRALDALLRGARSEALGHLFDAEGQRELAVRLLEPDGPAAAEDEDALLARAEEIAGRERVLDEDMPSESTAVVWRGEWAEWECRSCGSMTTGRHAPKRASDRVCSREVCRKREGG